MQHVIEKTANTESLTIVGYSVGAIYAIELVRKLESMGKHGRLILIDGSPEFLKLIISQHLNAETDEQIQDSVLAGICTRLFPEMNLQVKFTSKMFLLPSFNIRNSLRHL